MKTLDAHQIDTLSSLEKAGELLFKLRDYTPVPLVLLCLLFATPSVGSLILGGAVALFGELCRAYGVAFIGTISRTRSYSNGELVKNGPFSLLRNPLYFGNLLLSLGLSLMSGIIWMPLVVLVIFYGQYIPIVAWEEKKLLRIFGERYLQYQKEVPNRWYPALGRVFSNGWWKENVNWGPAWKSEKRTLTSVASFFIVMIALFYFSQIQNSIDLPLLQTLLNR